MKTDQWNPIGGGKYLKWDSHYKYFILTDGIGEYDQGNDIILKPDEIKSFIKLIEAMPLEDA